MLKKNNDLLANVNSVESLKVSESKPLDKFSGTYTVVSVDEPMPRLDEKKLNHNSKVADYGILEILAGTWYSYKEPNASRVSNTYTATGRKDNLSSGVHTTIMPSPGTSQNQIPGKFSFECEEYIEKLTFDLVEGGVRNRGGASEQFCGAVKYEQSIKSITQQNNGPLKFTPIHEENGMYLWLSNIYNHSASADSIANDQGIHYEYDNEGKVINRFDETNVDEDKILPAKELKPQAGEIGPYFIPDYTLSRSGVIPHGSTITLLGSLEMKNNEVVLQNAPVFIDPSQLGNGTWDYAHFAVSPTMGGGKNSSNAKKDVPLDLKRPFDLDHPPLPFTPIQDLNTDNDEGENLVYTQRMFLHDLYPYSVRPDLRLRDAIAGQNISRHIHIQMSSKNKTGAQGGILNVPFVIRYVPTVEMTMNMWIEEVEENGESFLQLQYEQIIFFEFGFGDSGGTTSWPHIQVNTLRKYKNLDEEQQKLMDEQFKTSESDSAQSGCPFHK